MYVPGSQVRLLPGLHGGLLSLPPPNSLYPAVGLPILLLSWAATSPCFLLSSLGGEAGRQPLPTHCLNVPYQTFLEGKLTPQAALSTNRKPGDR